MSLFKVLLAAILTGTLIGLAGCSGGEEKAADDRIFATEPTEGIYVSPFFNLSIEMPEGWNALTPQQFADVFGVGVDWAAGDDEMMRKRLERSMGDSSGIFAFFESELGAPVDFNPNVAAIAENVRLAPGVKTGNDYFFHMQKLVQSMSVEATYEIANESRKIGGVEFDKMNVGLEIGGQHISQEYYAARHGDYIVTFMVTYSTKQQHETLLRILDTITLDW